MNTNTEHKISHRLLSVILAVAVFITMFSSVSLSTFADAFTAKHFIGNNSLSDGDAQGHGWRWESISKTLYLFGVNVEGYEDLPAIMLPEGATIVVDGVNTVTKKTTATNFQRNAAIWCFGDLTIKGSGKLRVENTSEAVTEYGPESAIKAGGKFTLDSGILELVKTSGAANTVALGTVSTIINGGELRVSSNDIGISIRAEFVLNDGFVNIEAAGDAFRGNDGDSPSFTAKKGVLKIDAGTAARNFESFVNDGAVCDIKTSDVSFDAVNGGGVTVEHKNGVTLIDSQVTPISSKVLFKTSKQTFTGTEKNALDKDETDYTAGKKLSTSDTESGSVVLAATNYIKSSEFTSKIAEFLSSNTDISGTYISSLEGYTVNESHEIDNGTWFDLAGALTVSNLSGNGTIYSTNDVKLSASSSFTGTTVTEGKATFEAACGNAYCEEYVGAAPLANSTIAAGKVEFTNGSGFSSDAKVVSETTITFDSNTSLEGGKYSAAQLIANGTLDIPKGAETVIYLSGTSSLASKQIGALCSLNDQKKPDSDLGFMEYPYNSNQGGLQVAVFTAIPDPLIEVSEADKELTFGTADSVQYEISTLYFKENGETFEPQVNWQGTAPENVTAQFSSDNKYLTITSSADTKANEAGYSFTVSSGSSESENALFVINRIAHEDVTIVKYIREDATDKHIEVTLPELPAGACTYEEATMNTTGNVFTSNVNTNEFTCSFDCVSPVAGESFKIIYHITGADNYSDYDVVIFVKAIGAPEISVSAQNGVVNNNSSGSAQFAIDTKYFDENNVEFTPSVEWEEEPVGVSVSFSEDKKTLTITSDGTTIYNSTGYAFTVKSGETVSESAKFVISKALYTGEKTASTLIYAATAGENKVALPMIPIGAEFGTPSVFEDSNGIISNATAVENGELVFTASGAAADGDTAQIVIPVTGADNYDDYSITVTVTAKNAPVINVGNQQGNMIYGTKTSVSFNFSAENFDTFGEEFTPSIKWSSEFDGAEVDLLNNKITITSVAGVLNAGSYGFRVVSGSHESEEKFLVVSKTAYDKNKAVLKLVDYEAGGNTTVKLPELPDGAVYGNPFVKTDASKLVSKTPSLLSNEISVTTSAKEKGTTAEILVPVTGAINYEDYSVVVTLKAAAMNKIKVGTQENEVFYGKNGGTTYTVTAENFEENETEFVPEISWIGTAPEGISAQFGDNNTVLTIVDNSDGSVNAGTYQFRITSGDTVSENITYKISKSDYTGETETTKYVLAGTSKENIRVQLPDFDPNAMYNVKLVDSGTDGGEGVLLTVQHGLDAVDNSVLYFGVNSALVGSEAQIKVAVSNLTNYNTFTYIVNIVARGSETVTIKDGSISVEGGACDRPAQVIGTPVILDSEGNEIQNVSVKYEWFDLEGSQYTNAPSAYGNYKMVATVVDETGVCTGSKTYQFSNVHNVTYENAEPEFLKEAASCQHPAIYYKSCSCGYYEADSTNTFENGTATGHVLVQKVEDQYRVSEATYFERAKYRYVCDICGTVSETTYEYGETLKDTTAPTAEIRIDDNNWNAFWNFMTFGFYFKETKTVVITAEDNEGGIGIGKIEYFITDKFIEKDELVSDDTIEWIEYTGPVDIENNANYVIYARAFDISGNGRYISTDGFQIDTIAPVISGVVDGAEYCVKAEVTITDDNLFYVEINNVRTMVTSPYTNTFTVPKEYTIVAGDYAGGITTVKFKVNAEHNLGEWQKLNDNSHRRSCIGCDYYETDSHVVGTEATYESGAICAICGGTFGEPLKDYKKPSGCVITINGGNKTYTDTFLTTDEKNVTAYCGKLPGITLSATDDESGIAAIYYAVLSDNSKSDSDLAVLADSYWTEYTESFGLSTQYDGYCLYVKCVDKGGNVAYFVSPVLSYDFDAPEITGIPENGGVCDGSDVEIKISDDNLLYYTVNGVRNEAEKNEYTVVFDEDGEYEIIAFDIAGNYTQRNVVRYSDHVYGSWTSDGEETHTKTCRFCGYEDVASHAMGEWTENEDGTTHSRKCNDCGYTESGEHLFGEWSSINEDTQHTRSCTFCGKSETGDHEYGEWEYYNNEMHAKTCAVCERIITDAHTGGLATFNEKPRCDVCNSLYGEGLYDDTAPTGEIVVTMGANSYANNNNTLDETQTVYSNQPHTVTINAADEGLGLNEIKYIASKKIISNARLVTLADEDWTLYEGSFEQSTEGKYFYYAKITDNAGNATYICGVPAVYDCTPPQFIGAEADKGYCGKNISLKVNFVDDNFKGFYWTKGKNKPTYNTADSVTITVTSNDKGVVHTLKAVDLAGNESEISISLSYEHVFAAGESLNEKQHEAVCTICGFTTKADHNMSEWAYYDNTMHRRECKDNCGYFETDLHKGGTASYTAKPICDICGKGYGDILTDIDMPTGSITISQNGVNKDSTYTFPADETGVVNIKVQPSITLKAEDLSSGVASIHYALMTNEYTAEKQAAAIPSKNWKLYNGQFSVTDADHGKIIYVKITDVSGNVTYLRSDKLAIDLTAPSFVGIVDGKEYCSDAVFTVNDKNLDKVIMITDDEEETELTETDGKYTIPEGSGTVSVVAVDENGNKNKITIKVRDGHEFSEWTFSDKTNHSRTCQVCKLIEKQQHTGGTATYTETAICDICGRAYGTTLPDKIAPEITISTLPGGEKWTEVKAPAALQYVYYNDSQMVSIAADDKESGVASVQYKISFTNSKGETASTDFEKYNSPISLTLDGTYVITAKATDILGNVKTITTDYIVIDRIPPEFEGVSDGCTVCVDAKFYIKDVAVSRVLANGGIVVPFGAEYRIDKTYGNVTVKAVDKAGNETQITFRICTAHDFGNYVDDNDDAHARICRNCGDKEYLAHEYGKWEAVDDDYNEHICTVCGHKEVSEHRFGKFEQVTGGHSRVCADCGYTQTKAHETFTFTEKNDKSHEKVCVVCGYTETVPHNFGNNEMLDNETHICECSDCGAVVEGKHNLTRFVAIDGMHEAHCTYCEYFEVRVHEFGEYTSNGNDTHTHTCELCGFSETSEHSEAAWTDGGEKHEMLCPDCGNVKREEHSYGEWKDAGAEGHIRVCEICKHEDLEPHKFTEWENISEKLNRRTCEICGYVEESEHRFGSWVCTGDETHERGCLDCDEKEIGTHVFGDWMRYDSDKDVRSCISCGYSQFKDHEYGEWHYSDEKTHEKNCLDCGDKITAPHNFSVWTQRGDKIYERVCADCGYVELSEHRFSEWCGSAVDELVHERRCLDCGFVERENHQLGAYSSEDEHSHGRTCEICGFVKTEPHDFTDWTDTSVAASGLVRSGIGTHSRSCKQCGFSEESIHNYGPWVDENGRVHGHMCEDCGKIEKGDHQFTDWMAVDEETHIRNCALCKRQETGEHEYGEMTYDELTHSISCNICGKTETKQHDFGEWTEIGEELYEHTCNTCGYTEKTGHRYGSWTATDSKTHSRICEDCGKTDSRAHEFTGWEFADDTQHQRNCPICGYTSTQAHIGGEATCTESAVCELCGGHYGDVGEHTPIVIDAHDSSCSAEGYTGDTVCGKCGVTLKKGVKIAKKAHDFKNGVCTYCGTLEVISKPDGDKDKPIVKPDDNQVVNPPTGVNLSKAFELAALFATTPGITATIVIVKKKVEDKKNHND